MSQAVEAGFSRYLLAKRTVDDRSLNARVWDRLASELRQRVSQDPLRVLEVGAGIGTMVERLDDAGMLGECVYTTLDSDSALIEMARDRLTPRAGMDLEFVAADAFQFLTEQQDQRSWDLIIANAFLDLTDVRVSVPRLLSALSPGGLLYLSINYDGVTGFSPVIDAALDAQIEAIYNWSMQLPHVNGSIPTGSRTGRELLPALRSAGATILEAGSSDWVLYSNASGFSDDETVFLNYILGFVEDALMDHPDLDQQRFSDWLVQRRAQIETGELVYIAHQLDILARLP